MNGTADATGIEGIDVAGPQDARPIVLVHGAMFTRKMWAPQRRVLAEEHRVVAPDLPGHGARAEEPFRMEAALELLDEVVETLAGGRALLVGLSLGGYTATAFADRHPEKVSGLVVSGSSANPVGLLEPVTRTVSKVWRAASSLPLADRGFDWAASRWVRSLDLDPAAEREIVDAGFYPKPFGEAGLDLAGTDFRSAFASYPGPALVLNGKWDLINRAGERKHAAAAPDARVETIGGAGHVCTLERPDAYTGTVRRFERRVESRSTRTNP